MAKAYLGKISALVTANTSDFNSKLNASAKEVRSFAASMQSSLSRAQSNATASLRGIYTESQKVSRALQAVATQRLSFKGFDRSAVGSIREAVDQFRALQAASVAVNEPLSNAARTVERLSASVQQSFDPALKSAQKSAEYLDAALKRGGIVGEQSFERIRQRAIAAAEAADRLAEASQLASGGPRGRELAFAAPRVRDALSASADVRQRAANAPAVALEGGRVSSDVQKLVAIDNLIQKRRAEIESGTILNIDTTRARASLENLLAVAKRVRDQINSAIGGETDAENATLINRARAQREFYEESERLAKQAATDEVALIARRTNAQRESSEERTRLERQAAEDEVALIARRVNAQREGYEERTRLERQAAEDAATLLIRQARAQQEFEEERRRRDAVAASDAANEVAPAINRSRAQRESAIDFGLDLDAPRRQIEVIRGSIVSLKGQLDTLPAGVRAQFIPAILAAQQNLEALAATPAATTAELARAAREVDRLTQSLGRARQAASIPSFRQFARDLSTRQAIGELQALQQVLARVGAQAGGPAAQAYNRYAAALRRATREGTTELPATRRELERLQVAAAQAAAATGRISFRAALREIRRGGDIARGGFDNFSLAVNQAAFAIDDFFSSTGGLEFKLRAVSNNITQLAFILGGTEGLFIGLAAVIGGQVAVAISKYVNEGRTAEDQTKSLNDALAKQKDIVEGLASAYEKVAEAVENAGLSDRSRRNADVRRQVEGIQRQQRQARESRILGLDVGVAEARAGVARSERELAAATTVGQRVRAELELNAARQRQQEEERRALEASAAPIGGVREAVISVLADQIQGETRAALAGASAAAAASGGFGGQGAFALAQETERRNNRRIAELQNIGATPEAAIAELDRRINELTQNGASGDVILPLQQLRERLLVYTRQIESDKLATRISRGVLRIVDAMESASADLSSAFDGINGASAIESDLAAFGETIAQLQRAAAEAASRGDVSQVEAINADITAINQHVLALREAAAAVRLFGGELQRLSESVAQDLSSLEQRADDARRADIARPTNASQRQREQAENDVREARRAQRAFEDERASAVEQFEQDARQNNDARQRRIREIDAMLAVPANEVGADGRTRGGTAEERRAARAERSQLQESVDSSIENDPRVVEARRQRDAMTARAESAMSADRGRQLSMTPGQRAAEELDQQIADIREYFSQAAEDSTGLPEDIAKIRERMNEAIGRAREDMMRQVAPTIMGMADARENAILQGPSRAALNVNDVATMQGQQELNRLLRGDDAAKNVDLVNLQREANRLLEAIKNKENPVA